MITMNWVYLFETLKIAFTEFSITNIQSCKYLLETQPIEKNIQKKTLIVGILKPVMLLWN